jgi:release factor glutamine methyltransferase
LTLAFSPDSTLIAAFLRLRSALSELGVEEAEHEARVLLLAAMDGNRMQLALEPQTRLGATAAERLAGFAARRLAREPASRVLGARGFWTVELEVAPGVLDPRADTETVVALALRLLAERRREPLSLLDLGSGSGAILCALLSELPKAFGVAVDISSAACAATRRNLAKAGVADRAGVLCGRWSDAISGSFDLVVSNPPYVETAAIACLPPEVSLHDPWLSLDGGNDGLAAYREIARFMRTLLRPRGLAVVEVGAGQAETAAGLFREAELRQVGLEEDLGGHERAVAFERVELF